MSGPTSSRCPSTTAAWCVVAGALGLAAAGDGRAQPAAAQRAWQPDPQQRVALTLNTQLVQQPPSWQPRAGNPDPQALATAQASLGLEFRRNSGSQSARDLLKIQLTSGSALNFRPRSGGLVVTYRAQF